MSDAVPIAPLGEIPMDAQVAALPKADIHLHQEWSPRLDRVLAARDGRASYDWRGWAEALMREVPPGMLRLRQLSSIFPATTEDDRPEEHFIARLEDLLEEAAADGAVLVEMRFGGATALQRPNFMALFREAERRVRERHPALRAEANYSLLTWDEPERLNGVLAACERAAADGLGGIDLLYDPYETEADWLRLEAIACRVADAGLGLTAHAGEFSAANIASAAQLTGLKRLGHAVYAAGDPRLLDLLGERSITVECCLSCNVVLGAVDSYEAHPIRTFVAAGIPVSLCTDDPVQVCTTIGREYAAAAALGFTPTDLLDFTRNAVRAAFLPAARRDALLAELDAWDRPRQ